MFSIKEDCEAGKFGFRDRSKKYSSLDASPVGSFNPIKVVLISDGGRRQLATDTGAKVGIVRLSKLCVPDLV